MTDQANSSEDEPIVFETSELTIITADGRHRFWVEIAQSNSQRQQGLMERLEMPAYWGMLLDFGFPQMVHMWMKNTHIPLDVIFLDENMRILGYVVDTVPFSLKSISIDKKSNNVLEMNGGSVDKFNKKIGDKIIFIEKDLS